MAGLMQAQPIRQPSGRPCAICSSAEARRVERQPVGASNIREPVSTGISRIRDAA
jgi:hypothetical protein